MNNIGSNTNKPSRLLLNPSSSSSFSSSSSSSSVDRSSSSSDNRFDTIRKQYASWFIAAGIIFIFYVAFRFSSSSSSSSSSFSHGNLACVPVTEEILGKLHLTKAPNQPVSQRFYVCTDGGFMAPIKDHSNHNNNLATVPSSSPKPVTKRPTIIRKDEDDDDDAEATSKDDDDDDNSEASTKRSSPDTNITSSHPVSCSCPSSSPLPSTLPPCPSSSSIPPPLLPSPSHSSSTSLSGEYSAKTLAHAKFTHECEQLTEDFYDKLVAETVHSRLRWNGGGSPPFTQSSMAHLHPCIRTHHVWNVNEDVLFVMLASTSTIERVRSFRTTWGKNLKDNVLVIGERDDPSVGMITLPVLQGKSTRAEAPHRTLQGLIYVMSQPQYEKYSWIFMIDDDTWVNTRELPSLLYGWDVKVPMMIGFFWNNPSFLDRRTWPSGGSGMLVTRTAAKKLATHLYSPTCPFDGENDRTLGICCLHTGVAMVHSALFDPEATSTVICPNSYFLLQHNDGDVRSLISIHRATEGRMQLWQNTVDAYPDDTALAEKVMEKT